MYKPIKSTVKKVIVDHCPVSERYWKKGDKAIIHNDQIRLSGCWFNYDENKYIVHETN